MKQDDPTHRVSQQTQGAVDCGNQYPLTKPALSARMRRVRSAESCGTNFLDKVRRVSMRSRFHYIRTERAPRKDLDNSHDQKRTSLQERNFKREVLDLLFSYKGRINQGAYWGIFLFICCTVYLARQSSALLLFLFGHNPSIIGFRLVVAVQLGLNYIYLRIFVSATIKRLHDCDKSGWWVLVPVANVILAFFFPGDKNSNRYGEPHMLIN